MTLRGRQVDENPNPDPRKKKKKEGEVAKHGSMIRLPDEAAQWMLILNLKP